MAEFCIDCYRKLLAVSPIVTYTLSETDVFCEGCGEFKPCVMDCYELNDFDDLSGKEFAMPKKFYISDWHYGHANVIAFDNRPFKTVDEMNETLINNWNSAVSKGDIVYVLGDMFWNNATDAAAILRSMNGQKFLIQGNHDRINEVFRKSFVAVEPYLEVEDSNRHVVLSHYPIPFYKRQHDGWYHLYGHVHNSYEWHMTEHIKSLTEDLRQEKYHMYNVGAMMPYMKYTPRTLDDIVASYTQWKENNDVV